MFELIFSVLNLEYQSWYQYLFIIDYSFQFQWIILLQLISTYSSYLLILSISLVDFNPFFFAANLIGFISISASHDWFWFVVINSFHVATGIISLIYFNYIYLNEFFFQIDIHQQLFKNLLRKNDTCWSPFLNRGVC